MKRILVIIVLCAMLLASVATTAVTAANAPPGPAGDSSVGAVTASNSATNTTAVTTTYLPIVWYKPGKTVVFLPWQYNFRGTAYKTYFGAADHTEWAKWTTAYASVKGISSPTFSWALSIVGARWELKGITPDQLAEKTCTISMKVSYSLAAKGTCDAEATYCTEADLFTFTGFKDDDILSATNFAVNAAAQNNIKIGTITTRDTFFLSNVSYYDDATNSIYGSVAAAPQGFVTPSGSASAIMTVYSIAIIFN